MTTRFLVVVLLAVTSLFTQARPLPSSYSLAEAGFMIPIKNQGVLGTCWTFSSSTVFETSLVRQGLLPVNEASNLTSEWDMAIHDGAFADLIAPYNGWGGSPAQAFGYYTRGFGRWKLQNRNFLVGGGPVLRTGDPLNAYPLAAANNNLDLSPYVPPANQPLLSGYRLTQALEFVETDSGAAKGKAPTRAFRDTIKHAILRYGALDTNMNAVFIYGPPYNTFNFKYDTYAYTGNSLGTDHDVTIIGWNDDVPVYDSAGTLLGTGAWLIQNSWGKSFASSDKAVSKPDGCFWLGYCDTAAVKYSCAMVPERRQGLSNVVLQNQFFFYDGLSGGFPAGTSTMAATKLVPQTDTKLLRVGLWTVADRCAVDIRVYGGWGTHGPLGLPLAELRDVLIPTRGYSEVPLLAPLPLTTGQPIYVVVDFGSNLDYPAALDNKSLAVKDILDFSNLSWVSKDGRHWQDLFADASEKEKGIWILKGILGRESARPNSATLSVTSVRAPLVTSESSLKLRGVNSYNTERVLWRLGKGKVRTAKGGNLAWQIIVRGLKPGKNVVSIWPTAATGVATSPVKVTIVRL